MQECRVFLDATVDKIWFNVVGSVTLWPTRHREDPACSSGSTSHRVHLYQGVWVRTGAKVYW